MGKKPLKQEEARNVLEHDFCIEVQLILKEIYYPLPYGFSYMVMCLNTSVYLLTVREYLTHNYHISWSYVLAKWIFFHTLLDEKLSTLFYVCWRTSYKHVHKYSMENQIWQLLCWAREIRVYFLFSHVWFMSSTTRENVINFYGCFLLNHTTAFYVPLRIELFKIFFVPSCDRFRAKKASHTFSKFLENVRLHFARCTNTVVRVK